MKKEILTLILIFIMMISYLIFLHYRDIQWIKNFEQEVIGCEIY